MLFIVTYLLYSCVLPLLTLPAGRDQRAPIAQKLFHGDVNAEYITLLTHLDAGSCNRTIGILVDWDLENFSQLLDQETQTMRTVSSAAGRIFSSSG